MATFDVEVTATAMARLRLRVRVGNAESEAVARRDALRWAGKQERWHAADVTGVSKLRDVQLAGTVTYKDKS